MNTKLGIIANGDRKQDNTDNEGSLRNEGHTESLRVALLKGLHLALQVLPDTLRRLWVVAVFAVLTKTSPRYEELSNGSATKWGIEIRATHLSVKLCSLRGCPSV